MGGRGGRGGRGRGRGMSLEQLGVQRGEVLPDSIVGPPETYPPLEYRPCQPPQKESVEEYILCIKKEFQEHMQNSQYHIQPEVKCPDIERYSDRFQVLTSNRGRLTLNWSRYPKELHPLTTSVAKKKLKAKKVSVNVKKARVKDINVKETLEELEKKEAITGMGEEEEEEGEDLENKPEEAVLEELEEVDEELDDGTDYINNYFDNGEDYLDEEDDTLEEGGVY